MSNEAKIAITAEDRFSRVFGALKRDVAGAQERFAQLASVAGMANAAIGRIAFGGAVVGAGFVSSIRQFAHDLDRLNDSADATGATVEQLSALEDVARRNGGSLDVVTTSLVKLNQALTAAKPDSDAVKAINAIGLSAADLRRQDPAIAFQNIAKALQGFADDGNKARIVQELFGKSLREVAPFLKDLAEAGQINATVTAEQTAEAERFNKQLYALQTNAYNAGRSLTADLLPAMNAYLEKVRRTSGKTFLQELVSEVQSARLGLLVSRIEALTGAVEKEPNNRALVQALADAREEYTGLAKAAADANQQLKTTLGIPAPAPNAGGGRGFVNPALVRPKLPDLTNAAKAQATEAQRYLETLQKQSEALEQQRWVGGELQKITAAEQLVLDLKAKRIDGITPALERQLKTEAARLDLARQIVAEKEREAGFQKLLADATQRDINAGLSLLEQTPSGRRSRMELQVDQVLRVSRANPDDAGIQRQASQAIDKLRAELDSMEPPITGVATQFDKLADAIEKSMERSTSAVVDFVLEAKGTPESLAKAFGRDVLRELIEEPIRDTMKAAVRLIRVELSKVGEGGGFSLAKFFGGGGGGGMDWSQVFSWFSGLFSSGSTGRAGGGSVRAGQLVRWQENGREWFVPGSDGAVVNPAQQRALAAGSHAVTYAPVVHVNGDVSAQTVALVRNMLAADRAAFMRSLKTGGAAAMAL